jgi:hypothetical protein
MGYSLLCMRFRELWGKNRTKLWFLMSCQQCCIYIFNRLQFFRPSLFVLCTAKKFEFMCPQKKNCTAAVKIFTFMCLWAIYKFPRLEHLFSCSRKGRLIRGIYKSITEIWVYRKRDCSRSVPFLGIFVSNFRYCVFAMWSVGQDSIPKFRSPPAVHVSCVHCAASNMPHMHYMLHHMHGYAACVAICDALSTLANVHNTVHSAQVRRQCVFPQVKPQSTYIGRDETGLVYLPTQLERTLQLYCWGSM